MHTLRPCSRLALLVSLLCLTPRPTAAQQQDSLARLHGLLFELNALQTLESISVAETIFHDGDPKTGRPGMGRYGTAADLIVAGLIDADTFDPQGRLGYVFSIQLTVLGYGAAGFNSKTADRMFFV